jgi:hypothetical protein
MQGRAQLRQLTFTCRLPHIVIACCRQAGAVGATMNRITHRSGSRSPQGTCSQHLRWDRLGTQHCGHPQTRFPVRWVGCEQQQAVSITRIHSRNVQRSMHVLKPSQKCSFQPFACMYYRFTEEGIECCLYCIRTTCYHVLGIGPSKCRRTLGHRLQPMPPLPG